MLTKKILPIKKEHRKKFWWATAGVLVIVGIVDYTTTHKFDGAIEYTSLATLIKDLGEV